MIALSTRRSSLVPPELFEPIQQAEKNADESNYRTAEAHHAAALATGPLVT
jgi:hypothetical protein